MKGKKLLAGILSAAMVIASAAFTAFAEDSTAGSVTVKGIAGFENEQFATIQDAYKAISPKVEALSGLGQDSCNANDFNNLYTDNGKITWTITGKQTFSSEDNECLFSFGRVAARYTDNCYITDIDIIGGDNTAELVLERNVILPYDWWDGSTQVVGVSFSNLKITAGDNLQNISTGFRKDFGFFLKVKYQNCDINGKVYIYRQANSIDLSFDGCTFNATDNAQYALHIQGGESVGTVTINGCNFNNYTRGVNLEIPSADFVFTNNTIKSAVSEADRAAVQITEGKSFKLTDNTIDVSGGNAFKFYSKLSEQTTYTISNNNIKAPYLADDDTSFGVNNKITSSGNIFNDTDTVNCMKKGATVATKSNVTAIAGNTAPDMSGKIINVTNANAQDVLDGKYGDITGKTINFTENITEILDLARPTAYEGSKTNYYNLNGSDNNEIKWSENIADDLNNIKTGTFHYYRTLDNVTFTANEGVTVKGFKYNSGHVYATGNHDYVRDIDLIQGQTSYYRHSSMDGITFKGLTFTYNCDAGLYMTDCIVKDITFDGCTFSGTDEYKNSVVAIHFGADNQYFTNTVVKNCKIDNYYQGVYIRGVDGATAIGNSISNTKHNALAFQSDKNDLKGTVVVKENYLSNASDRAIRFNNISSTGVITINNNIMVNCGNSKGQLIAATSCADGSSIDLESNYWDGKNVLTAVSGMTNPKTTGITGGTWSIDVSDYCASGYEVVTNSDGTYSVASLKWTNDTDSGYYKDSENKKKGMMRFMFSVAPSGTVTASGIKYINANDITAEPTISGAVNTTKNSSVFQGDIVNIPAEENVTYFARAYITTVSGTFWSEPVSCTVNWNQFFTDYTGGAQ